MHATHTLDGELEPLAIVGIAFEFPQDATSEESFWRMVCEGRSASTEFPPDRLNIDAFYHPENDRPSTIPLRGGHFVKEDIAAFDAPFFSITHGEAACMDPQHRRLLETAYHALEDAGVPLAQTLGSDTSVYTGSFTNDYLSILQQDYQAEQRHGAMGIAPSMLANRLSWFFDFKGTSMNIDSACSSSLIALHLACQDLRAGHSSMALVGGANLVYHPNFMKLMSDFNFLSKDSRSWSFDERANGYSRGEGSAVIVVKRLADALRDGDTIRAVVRETGSNQDGRTPGITQPSQSSQIELIERTYKHADIDMSTTRFFEAHGTGTPAGDPIEAGAIGAAFGKYRTEESPLYIGAVKANIGHLEGCSGLAGVIKAILVLENGIIPPIAGLENLSKSIQAKKLPLKVIRNHFAEIWANSYKFPTEMVAWPECEVRRACINSFGFGGTNAVAILDDAHNYLRQRGLEGYHRTRQVPALPGLNGVHLNGIAGHSEATSPKLLIWSAPDEGGANRLSRSYENYIEKMPSYQVPDLAYTLTERRSDFSWKSFAVAGRDEQITSSAAVKAASGGQVAFVFTGQGAQYANMGRELLEFSVFRQSIESCEKALQQLGWSYSLVEILDAGGEVDMSQPQFAQPVTTCLQIALVDLLQSVGVSPSLVMGHSSGEVAAAYAAGAISKSAAIKVAHYRGVFSSELASQVDDLSMMAAGLSKEQIQPFLERLLQKFGTVDVQVGCSNSPKSITLTGKVAQLAELEGWLKQDGIFARRLRVTMAYHSRFMVAIAEKYAASLAGLDQSEALAFVPMISSVTGDVVAPQNLAKAEYWVRNLTSPVEFDAAMAKLVAYANQKPKKSLGKPKTPEFRVTHMLEVGPHNALQGPIRECLEISAAAKKPSYIASLIRGRDASVALLKSIGTLACAGFSLDLMAVNGLEKGHKRPAPAGMPRYPFNHDKRYWIESQLSTNLRFPGAPRHDLLGMRNLDWNPQIAQWRNVMRLAELPWLEDHTIEGGIVVPAAGYIVMAAEALKQLHDGAPILGIHVKDASFSHPIRFAEGQQQVETQVTLSTGSGSSWSQFRVFVMDNGSYVECSNGLIRCVLDNQECDRVRQLGPWASKSWSSRIMDSAEESKTNPYGTLGESAVWYGPAFRVLEQVKLTRNGEAAALLNTSAWSSKGCTPYTPKYSIHPATLDGLAQIVVPALSQLHSNLPTMVPVRVSGIWIDCNAEVLQAGKIQIQGECGLRGYRGASASCVGRDIETGLPLVYLEGLETTFINNSRAEADSQSLLPRQLCARIVWKPDVDLLKPDELMSLVTQGRPAQEDNAVEEYRKLNLAIMVYIQESLAFLEAESSNLQLSRTLQYFVGWMKYQHERLHRGELLIDDAAVQKLLQDTEARGDLMSHVENYNIDGEFFNTVGKNLINIFRGEVDPLQLIFHGGLADRYYEEMLANEHHAYPASRYLDLLSFKNPSMKILEVGAGTGGQTLRTLESLSSDGVMKWSRYDYTDISPSFFGQARSKFKEYVSRMDFKVCDISKDPTAQSFEAGTYDLVVASHVLHATDVLNQSLRNIWKLLKPGGKLLLFETTEPAAHLAFAFGLLRGWWSPLDHEERCAHSPCITTAQWDERLRATGFSGVDLDIPGQEKQETRYSSILISTAVEPVLTNGHVPATARQQISLLVNEESTAQATLAGLLKTELEASLAADVSISSVAQAAEMEKRSYSLTISLLEVEAFFLQGVSEPDYLNLRSVIAQDLSMLWISKSHVQGQSDPRHGLADGFGRVLMSEDSSRKFVTLELDGLNNEAFTGLISELAQRIITEPIENLENAYIIQDGAVHVSRVYENADKNKMVAEAILPRQSRQMQLGSELPLSLGVEHPGHIDTLRWFQAETEWDTSLPAAGDIIVRVKAIGLTERDTLIAGGKMNEQSLGMESAGIVEAAGQGSNFQTGDRVVFVAPSAAQNLVRVDARAAVKIPEHLALTDAAALATAAWTGYHALVNVARVQEHEKVLVHRAATPEGQVAIQIARNLGAVVFATADSPAERKILQEQLMLSDDDIFYIADGAFRSKFALAAVEERLDVIVGPLAEDSDRMVFSESLGLCGRLVDTSIRQNNAAPTMSGRGNAPSNVTQSWVDVKELLKSPALAYKTFQKSFKTALDWSLVAPQPLQVFPADEAVAAFQPSLPGKRVIALESDMVVTANVATRPQYSFSEQATYVIAGGLGGLGRSFAKWMVDRGARNLILLSRSGSQTAAQRSLVADLEAKGVRVETPKVDISNIESLRETLDRLSQSMPPVRGCIQASVALRDNLFPNMTHEDWTVSIKAKVDGSWNLHEVLPADLDFFIVLASLNGIIGGRAQANYGAGNTFKDALARYRLQSGQKAVSIDLGLMVAEGIVAENEHLLASMRRIGHLMDIHQDELLALLDHYCDPSLPVLDPSEAQILVGMELPEAVLAKGIDLHHAIYRPMFRHLFQMGVVSSASLLDSGPAIVDRASLLAKAKSLDQATSLVSEWFAGKIAQILGLAEADVDVKRPVHTYNVDSLVAIDLKNWFAREVGAEVEVFSLLGNSSMEQIAEVAATKSRYRQVVEV